MVDAHLSLRVGLGGGGSFATPTLTILFLILNIFYDLLCSKVVLYINNSHGNLCCILTLNYANNIKQ